MSKKYISIIVSLLLLVVTAAGCGKDKSPADVRLDALAAYKTLLEDAPAIDTSNIELTNASFGLEQNREKFGDHYEYFALKDIDLDGVPELIAMSVINFRWNLVYVYTYADGKPVLLKDSADDRSIATFDQNSSASGYYEIYFCEEGHIHNSWNGTTPIGEVVNDRASIQDKTSLTLTDCETGKNENSVSFFDIAETNTEENRAQILH